MPDDDAGETLAFTYVLALVGGGQALLQRIQVQCPVCGGYEVILPGHHLRIIRDLLSQVIEAYPDLVGPPAPVNEITAVKIPGDAPEKAKMN